MSSEIFVNQINMISGNDFSNGSKNTFWASPNMFDKLAVGKLQFVKLLKAVGFVAYGIAKMSESDQSTDKNTNIKIQPIRTQEYLIP